MIFINENQLVATNDGSLSLIEPHLNEAYHSKAGALFEARSLYVEGSGFAEAAKLGEKPVLSVFDVGLGLGYNALCTIDEWLQSQCRSDLYLFSVEKDQGLITSLLSGNAVWQSNWKDSWLSLIRSCQQTSAHQWSLMGKFGPANLYWFILNQDAVTMDFELALPANWPKFDFIWQDPFSPKKLPELWTTPWFAKLCAFSAPNCRLVTYSVARVVKDNLASGGWEWSKTQSDGCKRWWLSAIPSSHHAKI